jgi:hypothetical protein
MAQFKESIRQLFARDGKRPSPLKPDDKAVPASAIEASLLAASHMVSVTQDMNAELATLCREGYFSRVLAFNIPIDAFARAEGDTLGSIDIAEDLGVGTGDGPSTARDHVQWVMRADTPASADAANDNNGDKSDPPPFIVPHLPKPSFALMLQLLFLYACRAEDKGKITDSCVSWKHLQEDLCRTSRLILSTGSIRTAVITYNVSPVFIEEVCDAAAADDPVFNSSEVGRLYAKDVNASAPTRMYRIWHFVARKRTQAVTRTDNGSPLPDIFFETMKRAADIHYVIDKISNPSKATDPAAKKGRQKNRGGGGDDDDGDGDGALLDAAALTPEERDLVEHMSHRGQFVIATGAMRHSKDTVGTPYPRLWEDKLVHLFDARHSTQMADANCFHPSESAITRALSNLACSHLHNLIGLSDCQPVTWLPENRPRPPAAGAVAAAADGWDWDDGEEMRHGEGADDDDADEVRLHSGDYRRLAFDRARMGRIWGGHDDDDDGAIMGLDAADMHQIEFARLMKMRAVKYSGVLQSTDTWDCDSVFVSGAIGSMQRAILGSSLAYFDARFRGGGADGEPMQGTYNLSLAPDPTLPPGADCSNVSPLCETSFWSPAMAMAAYVCRNMDARQVYYYNYFKPPAELALPDGRLPSFGWNAEREAMKLAFEGVGEVDRRLIQGSCRPSTRGQGIMAIANALSQHGFPDRQAGDFAGFPLPARVTLITPEGCVPWIAHLLPLPHVVRSNQILREATALLAYDMTVALVSRTQLGVKAPPRTYSADGAMEHYRDLKRLIARQNARPTEQGQIAIASTRARIRKLNRGRAALQVLALHSIDAFMQSAKMLTPVGGKVPYWTRTNIRAASSSSAACAELLRGGEAWQRGEYPFTDIIPPATLEALMDNVLHVLNQRIKRAQIDNCFGGFRPTVNMSGVPVQRDGIYDPEVRANGYKSPWTFLEDKNGLYNAGTRHTAVDSAVAAMIAYPDGVSNKSKYPRVTDLGKWLRSAVRELYLAAYVSMISAPPYLISLPKAFRGGLEMLQAAPAEVWPRTATGVYANLSDRAEHIVAFNVHVVHVGNIQYNVMPCLVIRDVALMASHFHTEENFQQGTLMLYGPAAGGKSMAMSAVTCTLPDSQWRDVTNATPKAMNVQDDSSGQVFVSNETPLAILSETARNANNELVTTMKAYLEKGYILTEAFDMSQRTKDNGERRKKTYIHVTMGTRISATNHDTYDMDAALKDRHLWLPINPPKSITSIYLPEEGASAPSPQSPPMARGGRPSSSRRASTASSSSSSSSSSSLGTPVPVIKSSLPAAALHRPSGDQANLQKTDATRDLKLVSCCVQQIYAAIQARVLPFPDTVEAEDLIDRMLPTLASRAESITRFMGMIKNHLIVQVITAAATTITTETYSYHARYYPGTNRALRPFDFAFLLRKAEDFMFVPKETVIMVLSLLRDPFDLCMAESILSALADLVFGASNDRPLHFHCVRRYAAQVGMPYDDTTSDAAGVSSNNGAGPGGRAPAPQLQRGFGGGGDGRESRVTVYDMNYVRVCIGQAGTSDLASLARQLVKTLKTRNSPEHVVGALKKLMDERVVLRPTDDMNPDTEAPVQAREAGSRTAAAAPSSTDPGEEVGDNNVAILDDDELVALAPMPPPSQATIAPAASADAMDVAEPTAHDDDAALSELADMAVDDHEVDALLGNNGGSSASSAIARSGDAATAISADVGDVMSIAITEEDLQSGSADMIGRRRPRKHGQQPTITAHELKLADRRNPLGLDGRTAVYRPRVTCDTDIEQAFLYTDQSSREQFFVINYNTLYAYRTRSANSGHHSNTYRAIVQKLSRSNLEKYPPQMLTALADYRPPGNTRGWLAPLVDHIKTLEERTTHTYITGFQFGIGDLVRLGREKWKREHEAELRRYNVLQHVPCPPPLFEFCSPIELRRRGDSPMSLRNDYLPNVEAIGTLIHNDNELQGYEDLRNEDERRAREYRILDYDLDYEAYARNSRRLGRDPLDPLRLVALPALTQRYLELLNREQKMVPSRPPMNYPADPAQQRVNVYLNNWFTGVKARARLRGTVNNTAGNNNSSSSSSGVQAAAKKTAKKKGTSGQKQQQQQPQSVPSNAKKSASKKRARPDDALTLDEHHDMMDDDY